MVHAVLLELLRLTTPPDKEGMNHSQQDMAGLPGYNQYAIQLFHRWYVERVCVIQKIAMLYPFKEDLYRASLMRQCTKFPGGIESSRTHFLRPPLNPPVHFARWAHICHSLSVLTTLWQIVRAPDGQTHGPI